MNLGDDTEEQQILIEEGILRHADNIANVKHLVEAGIDANALD